VDDQDHTLKLLRKGAVVLGVIMSEKTPLQGCSVHFLGAMRYRAIAAPEFAAHYFSEGLNATTFAQAPLILFDRKDALPWRFIRRITRAQFAPPVHYLPTAIGLVEAATCGLGWCLAPELLIASTVHEKKVVIVGQTRWLDVPLYWQHAAVRSGTLRQVGQALRAAAADALHV
jgi:LysR family transcriptional regulator (chromosome initiation inhibitor)